MAGNTVALQFTADLRDLRTRLKELPDFTSAEARKAVKELNKSFKAAARAQTKAAKAAQQASKGGKEVGDAVLLFNLSHFKSP